MMDAQRIIQHLTVSMGQRIADLEVQLAMARAELEVARAETNEGGTKE